MTDRVEFEMIVPQSPEKVWRALTDPEALGKWLLPCDFDATVGARFRFMPADGEEDDVEPIQGEVVEVVAPRRLAYTWQERQDESPDLVTWIVDPVEAGTRIRVEHTRLQEMTATVLDAVGPARAVPFAALMRLSALLGGRLVSPLLLGKASASVYPLFLTAAVGAESEAAR